LKLGAENRNKVIAAAVLGGLALVLVLRALFSTMGPEPAAPAPAATTAATTPQAKVVARKGMSRFLPRTGAARLDPTLDLDLLKISEDTKYAGSGKNIFVAQAEPIPQPKASPVTDNKPKPPPTPPPPPILLKFYGFASRPGEPKKIFLSQGEDIFIASEGEIVNRRYKILRISASSVEIEDVVTNNRQNIPLTQG
jgi:hypothetical protein